jgi:hypothetical protein
MMTTVSSTAKASYEIRAIWAHGDVSVEHHFDPADPRFEVRQAGNLKYVFVATRAWQAEKRAAIEAAADLAGVEPPAPAVAPSAPAGPRPQKPVPQERIAPLIVALAQLRYEENPARPREAIMDGARRLVYAAVAIGYKAFTDLESDVTIGINRSHVDFEAEGREKIIVYNRH